MILCIGERVHEPELRKDPAREQRWMEKWTGPQRLRCMLSTPAMTRGQTRKNLLSTYFLPDKSVQVVNLLWPSAECGLWDTAQGRESARCIEDLLVEDDSSWDRIMLLGRRVADAFGFAHQMFGSRVTIGFGARAIILPHPSGRSRVLNDARERDRIRLTAADFLADAASAR